MAKWKNVLARKKLLLLLLSVLDSVHEYSLLVLRYKSRWWWVIREGEFSLSIFFFWLDPNWKFLAREIQFERTANSSRLQTPLQQTLSNGPTTSNRLGLPSMLLLLLRLIIIITIIIIIIIISGDGSTKPTHKPRIWSPRDENLRYNQCVLIEFLYRLYWRSLRKLFPKFTLSSIFFLCFFPFSVKVFSSLNIENSFSPLFSEFWLVLLLLLLLFSKVKLEPINLAPDG